MDNHVMHQVDFGTGQKKLSVYILGFFLCALLTSLAFWTVIAGHFSKWETFIIIYSAACIQLMVQLICFLRLNTQTPQARTNVMSLLFAVVILSSIVAGSVWIMGNLNFYMMH